MRVAGGDANPKRTDLSVRGLIELDGAANVRCARISIAPQRESIKSVRGHSDCVGRDLGARVVANYNRDLPSIISTR